MTAGTEGYEKFISLFIKSSQTLDFHKVCKDFIEHLPSKPANILDAGSGAGQNAAALAMLGFTLTAIEPISEFLNAAKTTYKNISVRWLSGSLPHLTCLSSDTELFDFVLIDGVWHHLDEIEREQTVIRLSAIIKKKGKCAISLRSGPAGMGTRVYPTDAVLTIEKFKKYGFECILNLQNQPSILSNKENVKWARLVLQRL
ncbi:MAG TPA: methyltransferase domain-containing protein [Methylophilaceae bacterium]|nr:methyltransferase domain-containing protein [Methylophilaceae bacterium]